MASIGIEAVGKSAVSMANGLLAGNAKLEMTTISFKTLLGSRLGCQRYDPAAYQIRRQTPFNLTGLEASTQKLLAFGYKSRKSSPS
jgi:hypothetical protein